MRFEDARLSSAAPKAQVVIVCHDGDLEEAHSIITAHAPLNWAKLNQIFLLEAGTRVKFRKSSDGIVKRFIEQEPSRLRRTLDKIAPPEEAARVVVIGNTHLQMGSPPHDLRAVTSIRTVAELRESLPRILVQSGLDWLTHTVALVDHYHDVGVDRNSIAAWREQFDRMKAGWIGDALLKLLDFWPSSKVCDALFQIPGVPYLSSEAESINWLSSYDCIAFNETDTGESAAIICRFAKKRVGEILLKKRVNLRRHLESEPNPSRILFLEDCLMTGTELKKLFDIFPDDLLSTHEIDLRFASGTVFGQQRLQTYLNGRDLTQVRILEPHEGFIPNLTPEGIKAAEDGRLLNAQFELADPTKTLINGIQLRAAGHFKKSQRKNMVTFCEAIGSPLMRLHLQRKKWTDERINRVMPSWALGPSGLGLLVGFAHGIPKPALPLFWLGGDIRVSVFGRQFKGDWCPLFSKPVTNPFGIKSEELRE